MVLISTSNGCCLYRNNQVVCTVLHCYVGLFSAGSTHGVESELFAYPYWNGSRLLQSVGQLVPRPRVHCGANVELHRLHSKRIDKAIADALVYVSAQAVLVCRG